MSMLDGGRLFILLPFQFFLQAVGHVAEFFFVLFAQFAQGQMGVENVQSLVLGIQMNGGSVLRAQAGAYLRGPLVESQKVRVMITEAQSKPVLTKISLYKTPRLSQKVVVQGLAFVEKSLAVTKGETLHFRIERSESSTPLETKISIQPGTGVHGVAYQDEIQVLQFQAGESKKDLTIPTLYFAADKTLDFYLNLTVDGQLVDQAQVQVS